MNNRGCSEAEPTEKCTSTNKVPEGRHNHEHQYVTPAGVQFAQGALCHGFRFAAPVVIHISVPSGLIRKSESERTFFYKKQNFEHPTCQVFENLIGHPKTTFTCVYKLQTFEKAGSPHGIFLGVDSLEVLIDRIEYRVQEGVHRIMPTNAQFNYKNSIRNITFAIQKELFDSVEFFDTGRDLMKVAEYAQM